MDVAWQGSLFDELAADRPRLSFDDLRHDALDPTSWIDVVPGWVPDHGELFGEDGYFGHGPIAHDKVLEVPFVEGRVR